MLAAKLYESFMSSTVREAPHHARRASVVGHSRSKGFSGSKADRAWRAVLCMSGSRIL